MSLKLYTSNKLEKLTELFAEKVYLVSNADPMIPETVVVPTQGMAAYLKLRLAELAPIAANLKTPFLNHFFNQILSRLFPGRFLQDMEESSERILRWRINALLTEEAEAFPELYRYFRGNDGTLKRWQLSGRIAALFDQYQIYRPDLLNSWRHGKTEERFDWQRRLFLRFSGDCSRKWAFDYFDDFFRMTSVPAGTMPDRVTLFGVGAMPPRYLQFFRKLAEFTEVHLFYLNPCCEYWSDQYNHREIKRLQKRDGVAAAADFDNGNPLLASLGTQGREFFKAIMDLPENIGNTEAFEPFAEYCDPDDPSPDHYRPGTPLLCALQQDIFTMCGRRADADGITAGTPQSCDPADRSVSVHNCHSKRREVEILHDRLLDFLQEPAIQPRDIIVMAPDINTYAPAIHAVFSAGVLADHYAIADRPPGTGKIRDVFLKLLAMRNSRFENSQVAELFDNPVIHRRFGFQEEDLSKTGNWLADAGIRWGIDSGDRQESCGFGFEEYSWQRGIQRLLCGMAMDEMPEEPFPAPAGNIPAGDAVLFGHFLDFTERLFRLKKRLNTPRSPQEWSQELLHILDEFFASSPEFFEELSALRTALGELELEPESVGYSLAMPLEPVLEFLDSAWNAPGRSDPFLRGKITFCSLVPMRSIPMQIVALLGLNDGEFPRRDRKTGFNLMEHALRPGDRSRPQEDRYLFLEAILSARRALLLFYQGQTARGSDRFPPAVPLGELLDYLKTGFHFTETEHRLQAFDFQYFTKETKPDFRSYSGEDFLAAQTLHARLTAPEAPENRPPALFAPGNAPEVLTLEELERFFSAPCAAFLRERANLRFSDAPESVPDNEPFQLDALERYQLRETMLQFLLAELPADTQYRRLQLANRLPAGEPGRFCFESVRQELARIPKRILKSMRQCKNTTLHIDLEEFTISGTVPLSPGGGEIPLFFPASFKGKHLLRGTLRQLAATAAGAAAPDLRIITLHSDGIYEYFLPAVPLPEAAGRLSGLLALYRRGWCEPLPFFPQSSFAGAQHSGDAQTKLLAAERRFRHATGTFGPPGDLDDPAASRCFQEEQFSDPEFQEDFLHLAEEIFPLIPEGERYDD